MLLETILSLWLFTSPTDIQLYTAIEMSKNGMYEHSELLFNQIPSKDVSPLARDNMNFWRLLNNFKMNQKTTSEQYVQKLEESFTQNLPERHKVLTSLMKEDLKHWKADDVADIARDMKKVEERLQIAQGGPVTQKFQKEIVDRLDKLIKESEDQLKSQMEGAGADGKAKGDKGSNKPSNPLDDSKIVNEGGKGTVDQRKFSKLQENWGSLPPREQARALQELTQGMSARHREAIENYFRNLATSQNKR